MQEDINKTWHYLSGQRPVEIRRRRRRRSRSRVGKKRCEPANRCLSQTRPTCLQHGERRDNAYRDEQSQGETACWPAYAETSARWYRPLAPGQAYDGVCAALQFQRVRRTDLSPSCRGLSAHNIHLPIHPRPFTPRSLPLPLLSFGWEFIQNTGWKSGWLNWMRLYRMIRYLLPLDAAQRSVSRF